LLFCSQQKQHSHTQKMDCDDRCQQCQRYFNKQHDLRLTKNGCCNIFKCCCGLGFDNGTSLKTHEILEQKRRNFIPCLSCAKLFSNVFELHQHQEDTFHNRKPRTNVSIFASLKLYLDAYMKQEVSNIKSNSFSISPPQSSKINDLGMSISRTIWN